ncbi:hypothetical protein Dda_1531 [Drechslerella dactyloides]|uniref:Uncharacterized protein n=1 Tax=Drechslerella dactyloides TaxID=74499 RepID=A0AAD6NN66_DREDA|nr:hypothetical protein Dda_1531 [Drechslerella dactyloides]
MADGSLISRYKVRIEELERQVKDKNGEMDQRIQQARSQQHYIQDLDQKYERLDAILRQKEDDIAEFERRELLAKHKGKILTDDEARAGIHDTLTTKIKTISNKFFRGIPWDKRFYEIENCLPLSILHSPFLRDQWNLILTNRNMSTYTFVDALLSSTITDMIMKDAFFRYRVSIKDRLHRIYSQALNEDFDEAVAWKARTAMLSQKLTGGTPVDLLDGSSEKKSMLMCAELDKVYQAALGALMHVIKLSPIAGPFEPERLERHVRDLVKSAAILADDWHKREFHIEVIDFQFFNRRGFHWHSRSMSKYATAFTRRVAIDPEKRYEIVGVIFPGFIRYESINDEVEEIVWEKAVVLLAEDESITQTYPDKF